MLQHLSSTYCRKPKKRFYFISSHCENQRTNVGKVVIKYSSNNIIDNVVVVPLLLIMMTTPPPPTTRTTLLLQLSFRNILTSLRNLVHGIPG